MYSPLLTTFMAFFGGIQAGSLRLSLSWKLVVQIGVIWLFSAVLVQHTAQAIDACVKKVIAWVATPLLAMRMFPLADLASEWQGESYHPFKVPVDDQCTKLRRVEAVPRRPAFSVLLSSLKSSVQEDSDYEDDTYHGEPGRKRYHEATFAKEGIDRRVQW